jgi:biopolymer transport protein ExbB
MSHAFSWLHDLQHADPIVLGALYLLLALSVLTWCLIAYKTLELWRIRRDSATYARSFYGSTAALSTKHDFLPQTTPLSELVENGLNSLRRHEEHHSKTTGVAGNLTETLTYGLNRTLQRQFTRLEKGLGILATIGNTAPFIGLFGTVIGIMAALKGISRTGSAGLDVVAGPIGEALIATAAGIGCAVPAVIGYNLFVRRLRVLRNAMEDFAYDVLSRIVAEHSRQGNSKTAGMESKKVGAV